MNENYGNIIGSPPEPQKKGRSRALAAVICAVLALALIAGAVIFYLSSRTLLPKAERSFEKTLSAIWAEDASLMKQINKNGLNVSINGDIGSDVVKNMGDNTASVDLNLAASTDNVYKLAGKVSAGSTQISGELISDSDGVAFRSDELLGNNTYSVMLDGFTEALKASVFYPGSGSAYALSTEEYEAIIDAVTELEQTSLTEEKQELITDFVKKTVRKLKNHIETEKETGMLSLGGVTAEDSTLYTVTFNEQFVLGFLSAFITEIEVNEEFAKLITPHIKTEDNVKPVKALKDLRDKMSKNDYEAVVKYIIKDGYMLAFSCELIQDIDGLDKKLFSVSFEASDDPATDPSFKASVYIYTQEILYVEYKSKYEDTLDLTDETFKIEIDLNDVSVTLSVESTLEDNGNFIADFKYDLYARQTLDQYGEFTLKGKQERGRSYRQLTVTGIKVANTELLTKSTLTVKITAGDGEIKNVSELNGKSLFSLTAGEMDAIKASVNSALKERAQAINSTFGTDVIVPLATAAKLESALMADYTVYDFCYDKDSGLYYYAAEKEGVPFIVKADPKDPSKTVATQMDNKITRIDVYNGKMAYIAHISESQDIAVLANASTLETIHLHNKFGGSPKPLLDVALTESYMIVSCTYYRVYTVKISNYEENLLSMHDNGYIATDPENDTVAIAQTNTSSCPFFVYDLKYSTLPYLKMDSKYYNRIPPFFQEGFFVGCDNAYRDGKVVTLTEVLGKKPTATQTLIYFDESLRAVYDSSNAVVTFYDVSGNVLLTDMLRSSIHGCFRDASGNLVIVSSLGDGAYYAYSYSIGASDSYVFTLDSVKLFPNIS